MILGNPARHPQQVPPANRVTVDDLFRRTVQRRPDAIALADPPNRVSFTDSPAIRLTYAEADRMVSAIAGRLRRLGLATDSIIGIQLPNTVENVLTLLGVLRAGMIAAPLPLLWRRSDAITALTRLGAKMLITAGRIGSVPHGELAMQVAAEIFPIRFVAGFGTKLPDGMIPLDDLYAVEKLDPLPPMERERMLNPAAHVAVITWDVTAEGLVPVARNHMELIAGGIAVAFEGRFAQDAAILACPTMTSFAGLALTVLPWLIVGGTLALHHPFDAQAFAAQCKDERCDTVIVPGPLVPRLVEANLLDPRTGIKTVAAMWRSPERSAGSPAWRSTTMGLMDVLVFGETCLLPARRGPNGRPGLIGFGPLTAPRGTQGAAIVAEVVRTEAGTVALRGPMVPRHPYPTGVERSGVPYFNIEPNGLVDTGYTCRVDRDTKAMIVTGPPAGMASVGGYRFVLSELQEMVGRVDASGTLGALPDALAGQRLAGKATDVEVVQAALAKLGVNPLIVGAFRDRRGLPAA